MEAVLGNLLPLFLIVITGSIFKKKIVTSREFWRGLEKLSFYLFVPAMLFHYSSTANIHCPDLAKLILSLILSMAIVTAVLIYYKNNITNDVKLFISIFQGSISYANYMLFPLGAILFQEEGLSIIATISPYTLIFINTATTIMFFYYLPEEQSNPKQAIYFLIKTILTNPVIMASVMGLLFNSLNITLHAVIQNTLDHFSRSAITILLFALGGSIKLSFTSEHFKVILMANFFKLIIFPIIAFAILSILGVSGTSKAIGILFASMPVSASSYIISRKFGGNTDAMSSIITSSIFFSTLPLITLTYIII